MRIISLFSGAGGLDLGIKSAGHNIVWANDIAEDAVATYKHNIGNEIVCADIKDINVNTIPDGDVVVGGFPCQGFSMANMRRSVDDERNELYKFFYNVIKVKQPKYFVAENVKGILSLGKGAIIKQITEDFKEAGYKINVNLVQMADYGVPQTRQRVIILGTRQDISDSHTLIIPSPTHSKTGDNLPKWVSIKEALNKYPDPQSDNDYLNHVASSYKIVVKNFTGHRVTDPDKPCPTILARGNGGGGVVAIPHYNGERRLSVRESAAIQTFPDDFYFIGKLNACYRQIGNAVPVKFGYRIGEQLTSLEE